MGWKITDKFLVDPQDNDSVPFDQGGIVRRSTWGKIKDYILGNASLVTNDKTVRGAINEVNTSLSDVANKSDLNTIDITKLKGYAEYNISVSTAIADNTTVYLTLDTVVKAGSLTELSGGGIKIKESGMYEINATTNFSTSTTGHRKIGIYKNGVLMKLIAIAPNNNVTVAQFILSLDCSLNDIITIGVYQNSGASLTNLTSSNYSGVQVRRIS
ncbi:hypothetical protein BJV38_004759 [Clostridium beijerinckii]|uniref:hypothetical protein n=1 Tax=Clostridium beijerinckii TaxID=1520 RepID=UPI00156E37DD|nr:hypothetical protein [Clostridium beijerinckii]NRT32656.1 hypothetical protein [Clostridium beijerinckii]NRT47916.1 hypothetical protein [Clostridium beijerinckii]NRZ23788.1 hypothetical protein [Clostridium beijerinckii]